MVGKRTDEVRHFLGCKSGSDGKKCAHLSPRILDPAQTLSRHWLRSRPRPAAPQYLMSHTCDGAAIRILIAHQKSRRDQSIDERHFAPAIRPARQARPGLL